MRPTLPALVALCGWLLCPAAAEAQIYSWRDASGTLVLSTEPKDPSAQPLVLRGSHAMRATRGAISKASAAFEELIARQAAEHDISADLVRAVIQVESAFNPFARSVKGAMGLMQLMPATAHELGVTNAFDPAQNIRGGVAYLKQLLTRFDSNVELALAAYNAGPGAVAKYGTIPPYRETREYVKKVRVKAGTTAAPRKHLYKVVEVVNGRETIRYTDTPAPGARRVTPYGS